MPISLTRLLVCLWEELYLPHLLIPPGMYLCLVNSGHTNLLNFGLTIL